MRYSCSHTNILCGTLALHFLRNLAIIICFIVFACVEIHAKTNIILYQTDPPIPRTPDEAPLLPCLYPVTTNQIKLIQLARAYSPAGLSYAEEQMLLGAAINQLAFCTSPNAVNQALARFFGPGTGKDTAGMKDSFLAISNSDNWAGDTIIRADLIKWLCTDPSAYCLVTYGGISFNGARVDGNLDLHDLKLSFPIRIYNSVFSDNIELYECEIKALDLIGTHIKNLDGSRLHVNGSLNMAKGFEAEGEVNLQNAYIGGDIGCAGGIFIHTNGFCILADGITVGGSLMFNDGFTANGELRFVDAQIGSMVDFNNGNFINNSGVTLDFTRAKIGSSFSTEEASFNGKVDLENISVNDWISFSGAKFLGSYLGGTIINGCASQIGSYVRLDCNYYVMGGVDFSGAKINLDFFAPYGASLNFSSVGGSLAIGNSDATNPVVNLPAVGNCSIVNATILNVVILNRANIAGVIDLSGSTMSRLVIVNDVWQDQGALDISSARIRTLQDQMDDWPKPGRLSLNNCIYDNFNVGSPVDSGSRIKWLQLQPTNFFLPQPYEQLATVFRSMGLEDDAKEVLVAKNIAHSQFTKPFSSSWWWYNVFGKYLISYGYASMRPLLLSFIFILFGAVLAAKSNSKGKIVHAGDKPQHSGGKKSGKEFQPLVYSFEIFVPLLNLDMAQHWRPAGVLRWYFWTHRLIGWLLTTFWLGALSGLVKS